MMERDEMNMPELQSLPRIDPNQYSNLPSAEKKYYPIGAFSKLVGIPISTLRFYDEKKMLVPQKRDTNSHYRYYSEDQVFDALSLLQLKTLGISLPQIKQLLACRTDEMLHSCLEERIQYCQEEMDRIEAKYQSTAQVYHQLGFGLSLLQKHQQDPTHNPIEVRYLPYTAVVAMQARTAHFLSDFILKKCMELYQVCEQEKLQLDGPFTMQFQGHTAERFQSGRYETKLFYPICPTKSRHSAISHFGGFWTVSCIHLGDYDTIAEKYRLLEDKITRDGLQICGDPFEEYLLNCTHINDAERFLTRVSYPVQAPMPLFEAGPAEDSPLSGQER